MTILRIIFVGMIAFAPENDSVTILLRDSTEPFEHAGSCMEPHIPLLLWDNVVCSNGQCKLPQDSSFDRCPGKAAYVVPKDTEAWVLDHEVLTIEPSGGSAFKWGDTYVPSMKEIGICKTIFQNDSQCKLHADYANGKLKDAVALTTLDQGSFQACHLVESYFPVARPAAPLETQNIAFGPKGRHNQPIADILAATITFAGHQTIKVSARKGIDTRAITLTPKACSDSSNDLCAYLILSNQPPLGDCRDAQGRHFVRYYDFAKTPAAANRRWTSYATGKADPVSLQCTAVAQGKDKLDSLIGQITSAGLPAPDQPFGPNTLSLNNRPICPLGRY